MKQAIVVLLCLVATFHTLAQEESEEKIIQFSGMVVTGDSLVPVPLVTVYRDRDQRGTVSDFYGFFSLPAVNGDTIVFSSIGYTPARYVIPEEIADNRISIVQFMQRDTVNLPVTYVYPWPAPQKFKEAFLALDLPDDEVERARKNLESMLIYEKTIALGADGSENYKMAMRQRADALYYQGGTPPISLLNPIAWAQFIQAWRNGDFKQ